MADRWRKAALDELIELKRGYDLPQQNRRPGSVPVVSSSGVTDYHAEAMAAGPGVVTGRYGTIGKVFYIDQDYWPLNTTLYVRDFRGNDPQFVNYLLQTVDFMVYSDKAAVPGVNRNHLHQARIYYPTDISEQRAIAHVLGSLDDKIELNRRMNETLEAAARAIFKSWFVDFDPVRAKSEDRDMGLPQPVADLFPDHFDATGQCQVPSAWQLKPIADLADIVGGSTPSTKEPSYWDAGTHDWATPKDLAALKVPVLLDTERRVTDRGLSQISSGLLPRGTVLMSSRAPIGYLAIAEVPVTINQGFIAMKPRTGISSLFLLYWAEASQQEILSRANGSTFLEVSKSSFRSISVVEPCPLIMNLFERTVRPLYERLVATERESRTLAALRDTLLPKLISGEVRVPQAARLVEAAGG
jgi:type I restriction enzyme, S subunit